MKFTLTYEGTLEEIAAIVEKMQAVNGEIAAPLETDGQAASDEPEKTCVSDTLMRQALSRRPLTKSTRILLRRLYDADDDERYVPRSTLRKATGLTDSQLNGVLGKFGQRVMRTSGYDGTSYYFKYKRHDHTDEWCYRLPDELRDVVREVLDDESNRSGFSL